mmetsp:Transcript_18078/g.56741  ORF Transcript_18078/g.56741 Transcript_18078/m.56741 type:complete len:224 (+) Transcript_18078:102-773(+)
MMRLSTAALLAILAAPAQGTSRSRAVGLVPRGGAMKTTVVTTTTTTTTTSEEPTPAVAATPVSKPISKDEVSDALQKWCDGVVMIGAIYKAGGDYKTAAKRFLDELYAFDIAKDGNVVLFKPTKAAVVPFRHDIEGALSYFANTGLYPEDHGFAITPFTKIRYEISGVNIDSDSATVLGHYWFTDLSGAEAKAEFSFQYVRDPASGKLKIVLHHSSLPYNPYK